MSCSKVTLTELEDIFRKKDDNFQDVKDKISIYTKITQELFDFYSNNKYNSKFKQQFDKLFNKLGRRGDIRMKKTHIVYTYQYMINNNMIENCPMFWHYIQKKSARNISGVNSFAILLPPYPVDSDFNGCNHNCYYCPNETIANGAKVDIARSYLLDEPAVQRGYRNGWGATNQMDDRMNSLMVQGLEVDKLELIIEGGTYTEYPMDFLETFHRDIFYSANVFFDPEKRDPLSLQEEIDINMTTNVRIIGICVETRPDAINDEWVRFFRKTGTTRLQIGVQHTDDDILRKINRGHTFTQSCEAVRTLKNNCFKVDIHLMPDLPGSSPEKDIEMFNIVFNTDVIAPDQAKIYPCEVTPYTVIKQWYDTGKYKPYSDDNPQDLIDVVKHVMKICPPWVRLPRIVRDIPLNLIVGGNKYSNLRQMINDELEKEGVVIKEIRSREIGRNTNYDFNRSVYRIRKYIGSGATEYFISLESQDGNALFGFIRLRIPPNNHDPIFSCLRNKGLIRELHVYNWVISVGKSGGKNATQHRGVGKRLLKIAEWVAWFHNLSGTAVITGEGVRNYYHKNGYFSEDTYALKNFKHTITFVIETTCYLFLLSLYLLLVYIYI